MTNIARIDEKQIHKTPRGIAIYPHLTTPDTKFNSAGEYKTGLRITDKVEEQAFLTKMLAFYDGAYLQKCQEQALKELPREMPPWGTGKDGSLEFKFKLKAGGVSDGESWKNDPPKLFDSQGKLIGPDHKLRIGNGSEIRIYFQLRPFYVQKAGITLRLKAVQLIELMDYNDAAYFGVEAEEDGFVYSAPTKTEPQAAT